MKGTTRYRGEGHGEIGQSGDRDGFGDGAGRRVRGRPGGPRLERRHQLHQEQEGSRRDLRRGEGQGRRSHPGAGRCRPGCRLQEARRRDDEEMGPHRRADQQRRHHQVPEPGRSRRRVARGFRPHPSGQCHRSLHDEPRRLSGDEEAVGGKAGAQLDREHLLDRRRHGRRQLDPLCLFEGRAEHAHADAGALAVAGRAGQHGVPGLHPDALAAGRHGRGELQQDEAGPGADHAAAPGRHDGADGRGGAVLPDQRQQHHRRVPDRRCRHAPRQPADEGA